MDLLSSKRFISITLAILLILNITLLGTLWWQNKQHSDTTDKTASVDKAQKKESFFERKLKLSDEQSRQFNALRQQHFQGTLPALVTISGLKHELVKEALDTEPDTLRIKALSHRIGRIQAYIEYRQAWHFNTLAGVCSAEQRDSLQQVLVSVAAKPVKMKRKLLFKRIRFTPLKQKQDSVSATASDSKTDSRSETAVE